MSSLPVNSHEPLNDFNSLMASLIKEERHQEAIALLITEFQKNHPIVVTEANLLHHAAEFGNNTAVLYLLQRGWYINGKNNEGNTPLIIAIKHQKSSTINVLLDAGADIESVDSSNKSTIEIAMNMDCDEQTVIKPLYYALKKNCTDDKQFAAKLLKFNCKFHQIAYLQEIHVIRYMAEMDYSVKFAKPYNGWSGFKNSPSIQLLLLYAYNMKGMKHRNIRENRLEPEINRIIFTLLTSQPTNYGYEQVLTILTQLNAIPPLENVRIYGHSALHLLANNTYPGSLNFWKSRLDNCDVNELNDYGMTPLFVAIKGSNLSMVDYLLERGATTGSNYKPLIHLAGLNCAPINAEKADEVILRLLETNIDPQEIYIDTEGEVTTVFDSFRRGFSNGIKYILAHLALIEESGTPVNDLARKSIEGRSTYQEHYSKCRKLLSIKIVKNLTIFDLITMDEKKMIKIFSRKKHFLKIVRLSKSARLIKKYGYYHGVVKKRVARIAKKIQLKREAVPHLRDTICSAFKHQVDPNHLVVDKIVNFYNYDDYEQYIGLNKIRSCKINIEI